MRTEYCDYVLVTSCVRYCDCCAMSLWHQVCPVLCIVYYVPGIRSVVYWVLGHWVLGPYALDTTSRTTAKITLILHSVGWTEMSLHCTYQPGKLWVELMDKHAGPSYAIQSKIHTWRSYLSLIWKALTIMKYGYFYSLKNYTQPPAR